MEFTLGLLDTSGQFSVRSYYPNAESQLKKLDWPNVPEDSDAFCDLLILGSTPQDAPYPFNGVPQIPQKWFPEFSSSNLHLDYAQALQVYRSGLKWWSSQAAVTLIEQMVSICVTLAQLQRTNRPQFFEKLYSLLKPLLGTRELFLLFYHLTEDEHKSKLTPYFISGNDHPIPTPLDAKLPFADCEQKLQDIFGEVPLGGVVLNNSNNVDTELKISLGGTPLYVFAKDATLSPVVLSAIKGLVQGITHLTHHSSHSNH